MKIPAVETTRQYELTFLVPGDFTDGEYSKVKEAVEALVKKQKGTIVSQEDWGKRPLAYKFKRAGKFYTEALYAHFVIELKAEKVQALDKAMILNHDVMRHLIVIASEEKGANQEEK